jgi:hypothetical protein
VRVVPAGRGEVDGIDPDRLTELLRSLAGEHGIVVIVGGPVQRAPNTLALARATDGVILVGRRDRARREDVVFAAESLRLVGATLLGVILTERGGAARRLRRDRVPAHDTPAVPLDVRLAGDESQTPVRRRTRRTGSGSSSAAASSQASSVAADRASAR